MGGGGLGLFLPIIVLGGFMFFMTRSQKKEQAKRQSVLDSMAIGDKVVTIGGLHGVIAEIDTEKSTVLIDCEGIVLEFNRTAISKVTPNDANIAVEEITTVAAEEDAITEVTEEENTEK